MREYRARAAVTDMIRLEEDRVLLQAFRRGDRTALTTVYHAYVGPLVSKIRDGFTFKSGDHRVFYGGHCDPAMLEDILQETFCRAFSPAVRESYDGIRPYLNYLFSIARNLLVDTLRSRGTHAVVPDDDLEFADSDTVSGDLLGIHPVSPEDALVEADVLLLQKAFVDRLNPSDQQLYAVRFQRGVSVAESAALLGVSEHNVKSRERRLRHRFFVEMREQGLFDGYRISRAGIERAVGVASISVWVAVCLLFG